MASFVSNLSNNVLQNIDVNLTALLDTIVLGIPCSLTSVSKNRRAVSGAASYFLDEMKCARLERLHTTNLTISHELSPAGTNGPAKSIIIVCHLLGGMGKGW
jgi:hypothetical protein